MALHSVAVIAVITDDLNRVLLTRRQDNGNWEPPGGGLERDEDLLDGLRREAREETGLDIAPLALTGVYKNTGQAGIVLIFRCKPAGGQLTLNEEVTAFRWITAGEAAEWTSKRFAAVIADALADLPRTAIVRRRDGARLL